MISLAINSHQPKLDWLFEMLNSAVGFDEILLYVQCAPDETYKAIEDYIERVEAPIDLIVGDTQLDIVDGFNRAISETLGEWVCSFCDDDTFITPNLTALLQAIRQGKYDDTDIIHFPVTVNRGRTWGSSCFNTHDLECENRIPHGSFFRRSVFDELGGYAIECCTDWEFWLRALYSGYRFTFFDQPVYDFRKGHNSAFVEQRRKYPNMQQTVVESAKDYIRSRQVC